jgi:hypothetical protein
MTILSPENPAHATAANRYIDSYGWTPQGFARDYPHLIRVSPTRARIW